MLWMHTEVTHYPICRWTFIQMKTTIAKTNDSIFQCNIEFQFIAFLQTVNIYANFFAKNNYHSCGNGYFWKLFVIVNNFGHIS